MMSPFPGLSTIAHLLIIVIKKTADFVGTADKKNFQRGSVNFFPSDSIGIGLPPTKIAKPLKAESRKQKEILKIFSAVIIETVLLAIILSSSAVITAGLDSSQSNLKVIERFAQKINNYYVCNFSNNTLSEVCFTPRSTLNFRGVLETSKNKN